MFSTKTSAGSSEPRCCPTSRVQAREALPTAPASERGLLCPHFTTTPAESERAAGRQRGPRRRPGRLLPGASPAAAPAPPGALPFPAGPRRPPHAGQPPRSGGATSVTRSFRTHRQKGGRDAPRGWPAVAAATSWLPGRRALAAGRAPVVLAFFSFASGAGGARRATQCSAAAEAARRRAEPRLGPPRPRPRPAGGSAERALLRTWPRRGRCSRGPDPSAYLPPAHHLRRPAAGTGATAGGWRAAPPCGGRGAARPLPLRRSAAAADPACPPAGRVAGARSEVVARRVTCPILTYPYLLAILLASWSPPVIRTAQWLVYRRVLQAGSRNPSTRVSRQRRSPPPPPPQQQWRFQPIFSSSAHNPHKTSPFFFRGSSPHLRAAPAARPSKLPRGGN